MVFGQRANGGRFGIRIKISDLTLRQKKKFGVNLELDLKLGVFFRKKIS